MAGDIDDIRSASRAIRDATTAFNRALGQALNAAGAQAGREIADELRQATAQLNEAVVTASLGVRPRRSTKAERTRVELLAAARQVFAEKGYEGASVGDIAAEAGYTKGALYANFSSKEELLLALARELTLGDAALKTTSVTADLSDVFAVRPEAAEHTEQTLLGLELYLYAIRHPEARSNLAPLLTDAQDGVAALVHRSRPRGPGSPEAPDGEPTRHDYDLAFALVALHTLGALMAPLAPEPDGPENTAATVRRLVELLLGASAPDDQDAAVRADDAQRDEDADPSSD